MAPKRKKQGGHSTDQFAISNGVKSNRMGRNALRRKQQQQLFMNENDYRLRLQEVLYTPDYIIQKVFRKDGPALGSEFDSLPDNAFRLCKPGSRKAHRACQENQRASKRQKVLTPALDCQPSCEEIISMRTRGIGKGFMTENGASFRKHGIGKGFMTRNCAPLTKHGIGKGVMTMSTALRKHGVGKGLMTLWHVMKPDGRVPPAGIGTSVAKKISLQERKKSLQNRQTLMKKLGKRLQEKKKPSNRCRKEKRDMDGNEKCKKKKQPHKEKCELALEWLSSQENRNQFVMLMDDEELELRELQAGPNPLACSAHLATNGFHGCPLCKDLLAKFPPESVSMKLPLYSQPWDSSPELVKKLLKVFHFICTYAMKIDVCSFTFDEFAQAFVDQDTLVLGQVHVALLKVLLSDVELELNSEYFSHASKSSKFLELLHSVDAKKFVLQLWQRTLNALTWTEIFRQVLVAAGFGSKQGTLRRESLKKEVSFMEKYGLSPGTLKGELFNCLLIQGNNGMKVSELSKIPSIAESNRAATSVELELLISAALSSDITLFEKISSSGYRLRVNPTMKESGNSLSDSEDFGSVDDESDLSWGQSSAEYSDCEQGNSSSNKLRRRKSQSSKNNMLEECTEIDESHPGEVWLLGLMEGEYSDLSIEEKLSAMLALIDLVSSGSTIRMEQDPVAPVATFLPNLTQHGSGAKIKKSTGKQNYLPTQVGCCSGVMFNEREANTTSALNVIDSLIPMSKTSNQVKSSSKTTDHKVMGASDDLHPMQSIYLGSDRRYNRYWLFLGPCDDLDPGHKRIYFESSDDGHWEVIENEEALCNLVSALDRRGNREAFLLSSLEKRELYLSRAMSNTVTALGTSQLTQSDHSDENISRENSSSAVSDVDNLSLVEIRNDLVCSDALVFEKERKAKQQRDKWNRAQAFDRWIWKSFYYELKAVKHGKRSYLDTLARCEHCHDLYWRDEKHCPVCHSTFELDFDLEEKYAVHAATCQGNMSIDKFPKHKVLSSQLQALKAALSSIESVMPDELFIGAWAKSTHNLWAKRLRRASTLTECLQVIADFVNAMDEDKLYQFDNSEGSECVLEEFVSSFPTMPQTSSAVALWLVKLDELVAPHLERVQSRNKLEVVRRLEGRRAAVR